jgi:hypothetical protein
LTKNDIDSIFQALGGKNGLIKWAKKNSRNLAQLYSMIGQKVLAGTDEPPIAEPDPVQMRATLSNAVDGILIARHRMRDVPNTGSAAHTKPAIDSGISQTPRGIADTPEQRLLESPPRPDVSTSQRRDDKPRRVEPTIVGIHIASESQHQPSATELFYSWSDSARPTSPPRGWSG